MFPPPPSLLQLAIRYRYDFCRRQSLAIAFPLCNGFYKQCWHLNVATFSFYVVCPLAFVARRHLNQLFITLHWITLHLLDLFEVFNYRRCTINTERNVVCWNHLAVQGPSRRKFIHGRTAFSYKETNKVLSVQSRKFPAVRSRGNIRHLSKYV